MAIRVKPGTKIRWWIGTAYKQEGVHMGYSTYKQEGVYMGYCKSGVKPETVCPELAKAPSSRKKFGNPISTSTSNRVIVKVPKFHATTKEALAPHYFVPRVTAVTYALVDDYWVKINPKEVQWL